MPTSCTYVFVHYVWATWDRMPLIDTAVEARLYAAIAAAAVQVRCEVRRIGGTEDHVHVLARLHPTVSTAQLAKEMKGASSHLTTHCLQPDRYFRWQGTYGAFSVGPEHLEAVMAYIDSQKARHGAGDVLPEWERRVEEAEGGGGTGR